MMPIFTIYHSPTEVIQAAQYGGPRPADGMVSHNDLIDFGLHIEPVDNWGYAFDDENVPADAWRIYLSPDGTFDWERKEYDLDKSLTISVGDWLIRRFNGSWVVRGSDEFTADVKSGNLVSEERYREESDRKLLQIVTFFAYDKDVISEGQASRLLDIDRLEFRRIYLKWQEDEYQAAETVSPSGNDWGAA